MMTRDEIHRMTTTPFENGQARTNILLAAMLEVLLDIRDALTRETPKTEKVARAKNK